MGTMKSVAKAKVANASKPSNREDAMLNRAGGVAFEIKDAATKLLTMTGGRFFAEPSYYSDKVCVPVRISVPRSRIGKAVLGVKERFGKLLERVHIFKKKSAELVNCSELDDVAQEVIATAIDVCRSKSPRDALAIANWLRNEANIRLTPQVILVLASHIDGAQPFVRHYTPRIVRRPDEVKTCLLMHRYFFGMKTVKNCLAQGLADRLSQFNEAALMKYDGKDFPRWKDVLLWLPRRKGKPLSPALARYFRDGKVSDETPVARDRVLLAKCKEFNAETKRLAKSSHVNWEVLLSQFGNSAKVWKFLIGENLVGYMAMLRNLRNILEASVSKSTADLVYAKLTDENEVRNSKQMPFRFIAAYNSIQNLSGARKFMEALEDATEVAMENCSEIPGHTLVAIDSSGSMGSAISVKSQMSYADVAAALGAIVARKAAEVDVLGFDSNVRQINITKRSTMMDIHKKVGQAGGATNTHLVMDWMMKNEVYPDRVIILSDMQAWSSGSYGWSRGESCADMWSKYRRSSKAAGYTWLHSVHIGGHGDTPVAEDEKRTHLLGGMNEAILQLILQAEGIGIEENVPAIKYIRDNF